MFEKIEIHNSFYNRIFNHRWSWSSDIPKRYHLYRRLHSCNRDCVYPWCRELLKVGVQKIAWFWSKMLLESMSLFFLIGNQRWRLFDKDFALLSHAPCRAEDRWSKGAIFNFHYTVVVKTLFLWLICSVRLGESETTVPPSEWIENPSVEKCSLASGPNSSLLSPL